MAEINFWKRRSFWTDIETEELKRIRIFLSADLGRMKNILKEPLAEKWIKTKFVYGKPYWGSLLCELLPPSVGWRGTIKAHHNGIHGTEEAVTKKCLLYSNLHKQEGKAEK